jgi:DNA-directed RNA polymerase II subunit RPB1
MLGVKEKRLTSRRGAKTITKTKKRVKPEIKQEVLLEPSELQKRFAAPKEILPISLKEKKIISSKSLQKRKKLPNLDVSDVNYTIISNEELQELKTFEATNTEDEGANSVNDPRGGTIDNHTLCAECHLDNMECPGHLGVINLNEHVIHPMFIKEVVNVLTSICGSCGGSLLPEESFEKFEELPPGSKRLQAIADASKGIPCRRSVREEVEEGVTPCISNPIYKQEKSKEGGRIFYTRETASKTTSENILSIKEIEIIFDSISQKDSKLLGFSGGSHPIRFILKSLPVIPLCSRAPVVVDGQVKPDDITTIYKDIVRHNNELKNKNLKEDEREAKISSLFFSISHLINNSDKKYRQGKHVYQSIKDRIQGKEALIRDAIMGKRVNYSGRTVLGPDPSLKFGQIRIPRAWAPYLTQHEIITPENFEKMSSLLRSGRITFIIPSKGKLQGKYVKVNEKLIKEYDLSIGDEVDRWLENGDWVIFNRQPTLHKQGIMGYEVVLGDPLTIGLHLGYTKQHNAD